VNSCCELLTFVALIKQRLVNAETDLAQAIQAKEITERHYRHELERAQTAYDQLVTQAKQRDKYVIHIIVIYKN